MQFLPSDIRRQRSVSMPRKGENIYKRKDGRWEARYIHHYEGGKAKYKSIYGNSYTEVRAKRLEELSKPENMKATAVKPLSTLQEICVLWLNSKKPDVKESTFTRYVRIVEKYILPSFEMQQLAKIDAIIINKAFDLLKNVCRIKRFRIFAVYSKAFGVSALKIIILVVIFNFRKAE